ncbi:hypothetical protein PP7435_CHR2-0960 [Komagataella phaffii CBS 7435]|nr:Hypothetical protein BQ9382_C2-5171 [Komagataella phaffii CBS 7435]CCA38641.1 hypothetical protein PP7435_CHR2-0960 [Komagataella phaffii CBS 7435]
MVQGAQKLAVKKKARVTKQQMNPRKAAPRIIKARNQTKGIKLTQKLNRIHSASLVAQTERLVASRVGHLELVKGSRRQLEKAQKEKDKKKPNAAKASKLTEKRSISGDLVLGWTVSDEKFRILPVIKAYSNDQFSLKDDDDGIKESNILLSRRRRT